MLLSCGVCGKQLGLVESLRWRSRGPATYPTVVLGGARQELKVRCLCEGCQRQAERIRGSAEPGEIVPRDGMQMG